VPSSNPRVFVSYTAIDEPFVTRIAPELSTAGFDIWFAPTDLPAGERLSSIHDRIAASDAFMVILTSAASNSQWVLHEVNTALALQLGGKAIRIIPVYLGPTAVLPAVADIVGLRISPDLRDPIPTLTAALHGQSSAVDDFVSQFSFYLQNLLRIPSETYRTLTNIEGLVAHKLSDGSPHTVDPDIKKRVIDRVQSELASCKVNEADLNRALQAITDGHPLPIVDGDKFPNIHNWLRQFGSKELLILAASLLAETQRGVRGITLQWLATSFVRHQLKATGSEEELRWQAESLATRAREAGLLVRSTEWNDPRTYGHQDELVNPSFDMGPIVRQIGPLVKMFQDA
jgi:hypothetical protein